MMSLLNSHLRMHVHLYLLTVNSLLFTYLLRTLLAMIHPMTLIKTSLYQMLPQLGRELHTFLSLLMGLLEDTGVRRKWKGAGKAELDNLTHTGTITRLPPEQRDELRRKARVTGQKHMELPAKAVFTMKPSKLRVGRLWQKDR